MNNQYKIYTFFVGFFLISHSPSILQGMEGSEPSLEVVTLRCKDGSTELPVSLASMSTYIAQEKGRVPAKYIDISELNITTEHIKQLRPVLDLAYAYEQARDQRTWSPQADTQKQRNSRAFMRHLTGLSPEKLALILDQADKLFIPLIIMNACKVWAQGIQDVETLHERSRLFVFSERVSEQIVADLKKNDWLFERFLVPMDFLDRYMSGPEGKNILCFNNAATHLVYLQKKVELWAQGRVKLENSWNPCCACFSGNDSYLATGHTIGNAHMVKVWNMEDQNKLVDQIAVPQETKQLCFDPTSRKVVCVFSDGIQIWDLDKRSECKGIAESEYALADLQDNILENAEGVYFAHNVVTVYVRNKANGDQFLAFWNTLNNTLTYKKLPESILGPLSQDLTQFFVGGSYRVYDAPSETYCSQAKGNIPGLYPFVVPKRYGELHVANLITKTTGVYRRWDVEACAISPDRNFVAALTNSSSQQGIKLFSFREYNNLKLAAQQDEMGTPK